MRSTGIILLFLFTTGTALASAASLGKYSLRVHISLSEAARARLGPPVEGVTVASYWYGSPKPAFASKADETGNIQVAARSDMIAASGGTLILDPKPASSAAWDWIEGPVSVNVNVYSSRTHFPDNLLACDFIDGVVTDLDTQTVNLHCTLITENSPTRHFPTQTQTPE